MNLGGYCIEIIPDCEFRLDGGAMFGVVPRVLWERVCPPDDLNRIRMNMNCVFIETPEEKILIDTGIGEKWTEKQTAIYGIFRQKPLAETLLEKTGCRPEDITIVVNTHLHFDHAGGNTILEPGFGARDLEKGETATWKGPETPKINDAFQEIPNPKSEIRNPDDPKSVVPQFPNARYLVSKSEFEAAENPHERDRASYLSENWRPVVDNGQLEFEPDSYEVVEGLTLQTVRGHSKTMQTWRLDRGGETLYGFADLVPTTAHLPYPWIMGYDLFPTKTLEVKKELLPRAVRENWLCLFYHDLERPLCRLAEDDNGRITAERC